MIPKDREVSNQTVEVQSTNVFNSFQLFYPYRYCSFKRENEPQNSFVCLPVYNLDYNNDGHIYLLIC